MGFICSKFYFCVFKRTISVCLNLENKVQAAEYMTLPSVCLKKTGWRPVGVWHSDSQYRSGLVSVDKASDKSRGESDSKTSGHPFQNKTAWPRCDGHLRNSHLKVTHVWKKKMYKAFCFSRGTCVLSDHLHLSNVTQWLNCTVGNVGSRF